MFILNPESHPSLLCMLVQCTVFIKYVQCICHGYFLDTKHIHIHRRKLKTWKFLRTTFRRDCILFKHHMGGSCDETAYTCGLRFTALLMLIEMMTTSNIPVWILKLYVTVEMIKMWAFVSLPNQTTNMYRLKLRIPPEKSNHLKGLMTILNDSVNFVVLCGKMRAVCM